MGILRAVEGFDIHKVPDELLSATDEDISEWMSPDLSDDGGFGQNTYLIVSVEMTLTKCIDFRSRGS